MAAITIKVEVLDADGRVIETDHAYGNTTVTAKAAASGLARTLEHVHADHPLGPVHAKIGRAVKG
jgi:hypothetical protein